MQKRKIDELISQFNRKVADMDIDMEYKMELLGMITAIGFACEKELSIEPERNMGKWIDGDALMMRLADWWYSSFGEDETDEAKAIRAVMDQVEEIVKEMSRGEK